MTPFEYIAPGVTLLFVLGGIFGFGWLKIIKETNNLLREQNKELKVENDNYKEKHEENVRAIASMQGQIDVLKSIPLVNIDTTLKEISKFNKTLSETNIKILDRLDEDAKRLKKDTTAARNAAKVVKSDLEESNK